MGIRKEDFNVIEDTINDIEYFYEEEAESKRNRKVILKYKLLTALIITIVSFFLITAIGITRMKMLGTDNLITRNEMVRLDFIATTDSVREFGSNVYEVKIPELQKAVRNEKNYDYDSLNSNIGVDNTITALSDNIAILEGIEVPNDGKNPYYLPYKLALMELLNYERVYFTTSKQKLESLKNFDDFDFDDVALTSTLENIKNSIERIINLEKSIKNPNDIIENEAAKVSNVSLVIRKEGENYVFY